MSYRVNAAGMDSMRALSPDIWHNCNVIDKAGVAPGMGSYYFDDFTGPFDPTTALGWTLTQEDNEGYIYVGESSGARADNGNDDLGHGVLGFDSENHNAADLGINAQMLSAGGGGSWLVSWSMNGSRSALSSRRFPSMALLLRHSSSSPTASRA